MNSSGDSVFSQITDSIISSISTLHDVRKETNLKKILLICFPNFPSRFENLALH